MFGLRVLARISVVLLATGFSFETSADEVRQGLLGIINASAAPPHIEIRRCPSSQFLVGVSASQTYRMTGYREICASARSYGIWSDASQPIVLFGAPTRDRTVSKECPSDYFIRGLAVTIGRYSVPVLPQASRAPSEARNALNRLVERIRNSDPSLPHINHIPPPCPLWSPRPVREFRRFYGRYTLRPSGTSGRSTVLVQRPEPELWSARRRNHSAECAPSQCAIFTPVYNHCSVT
jgi:hypothetical protein